MELTAPSSPKAADTDSSSANSTKQNPRNMSVSLSRTMRAFRTCEEDRRHESGVHGVERRGGTDLKVLEDVVDVALNA